MEKKVLFSIPLFRGTKKAQTYTFNNFRQALQGIIDEKLFYVEHYADVNFYIDGCHKVIKSEAKRIYFADVKPYKELWYRAVNDKWLKVPQDFLYDKKYQYQKFLFSARAREISEIPKTEFFSLQEKYYRALLGKDTIQLTKEEDIINSYIPVQQDVECGIGNGISFVSASQYLDFYSALKRIKQNCPSFISFHIGIVSFDFAARRKPIESMTIYAEENKISAEDALKKSKNSKQIIEAIEQGEKVFIYNPKQGVLKCRCNSIFVPRETILHKWMLK